MSELKFNIPLQPITKKNSQQLFVHPYTHKPGITQSKQYKQYLKNCGFFLKSNVPIEHSVNVKAVYYMQTRRRVDLCNLHAALHDILVHYRILADDNSKIIHSTDGSYVSYDKKNPHTEITITKVQI